MLKNILLSIITVAIVAAGGIFIYQTITTNNDKQAKAGALTQARKDCSDKIHPGAADGYVYSEYNKCIANKGFDEFKQ